MKHKHPTHLPTTLLEHFTHPDTGTHTVTRVRIRHPFETLRLQRLAHQLGKSRRH